MSGTAESDDQVTLSRADFDTLLAVATLYLNSFTEDELMTLPGKLIYQQVEDVVARYGHRY